MRRKATPIAYFKYSHSKASFLEQLNAEIRDREKVTRNLKKDDSPILTGMQLFHNYVRPHMGPDGKTPADLAGIHVDGENKWLTIIQNASKPDNPRKVSESSNEPNVARHVSEGSQ